MSSLNIIGNEATVSAVSAMIDSGRISHSIVIYGENGCGKKTLAGFIAAKLLCKNEKTPCLECRSCKMITHDGHPDFIKVAPSLKSGGYKIEEDLRKVVSDAYIAPSESRYKIYLIADMDKTPSGSQNSLLKLIEEPPDHAVIILTASSKEYFLPTIVSRVTALAMTEVSREECVEYLKENTDKAPDEISSAVEAMGGNIGRCLEFFNSKSLPKAVGITKEIADAVSEKNEYDILKAFWKLDGNRELTLTVLKLLENIFRDAVMIRLGAGERLLGCDEEKARAISSSASTKRLSALCLIPEKYIERINGNANLTLCLNSVCADIKSVI